MVTQQEHDWALLSYRIPREPSTPRIAVWRKLKDLGVAQLGDGLVALPHDARTKEHLEWVAAQVIEAGGDATVWLATTGSRRDSAHIAQQMREARDDEYRELVDEITSADEPVDARTVARFRRQWRRIDRRDYFRSRLRDRARVSLADLVARAELEETFR